MAELASLHIKTTIWQILCWVKPASLFNILTNIVGILASVEGCLYKDFNRQQQKKQQQQQQQ
jgi:hypothetical protein